MFRMGAFIWGAKSSLGESGRAVLEDKFSESQGQDEWSQKGPRGKLGAGSGQPGARWVGNKSGKRNESHDPEEMIRKGGPRREMRDMRGVWRRHSKKGFRVRTSLRGSSEEQAGAEQGPSAKPPKATET